MNTYLESLMQYSTIVADTGEIEAIRQYRPRDATTNPSLIAKAAQMDAYKDIVDEALRWAKDHLCTDAHTCVNDAMDQLAVQFGIHILEWIDGRVSTEVDARLSYDTQATIDKARSLIERYQAAGVDRERVLIKIAATWEGIEAARVLEQEGIHCNLTLLFGLHQAIACADAGVTLISPFVGRILDWHKQHSGRQDYPPDEDPGVVSVRRIYNYLKTYGYPTEIMAASFRNLGEIIALSGCDLLTISPKLLDALQAQEGDVPRRLDPALAGVSPPERITMDRTTFEQMHADDAMATDKLREGIDGFTEAIISLEKQLIDRFTQLA